MMNPMTGDEMEKEDEYEKVLIYGIDVINFKLLKYLFCNYYEVMDVTDCFSDLLALKAAAIIINPNELTQEEWCFLDGIYKEDNDTTLMIFSKEPTEKVHFKYHIIDLEDEYDSKLRILAEHMRKRKIHLEWELDCNFLDSVILVDEETNGSDEYKDELICIEAVYVEKNIVRDRFYSLIKPKNPLTKEIEEIVEITNEQLEKAADIETVMMQFEKWRLDRKVLVYDEDFVYPFFARAYASIGMREIEHIYDLKRILSEIFPNITNKRLWKLNEFCGVGHTDSGIDAMKKIFSKVYEECLEIRQ